MIRDVVLALWFFVPAGAANAAPIVAAHTPALARYTTPLDFGRTFRGRPLLGANKTWRGLLAGVLLAVAVLWIEQTLVASSPRLAHLLDLNYAHLPTLLLGPLFGIGALGGDALKSFFKRRVAIRPGQSWFPFDQLDFVVGAGLLTLPVVRLPLGAYSWSLLIWPVIHLASSFVGYLLGLKDQPI